MRRLWLAEDGSTRAVERLAPEVQALLYAAGDRLAETSTLVAQRYWTHAASAWRLLGAEGFGRWLGLGEALAAGEPAWREGAAAYFAVEPAALGGIEQAERWCALGRTLAARARRLGTTFLERTPPVLARRDGVERLAALVAAALRLHDGPGWRGGFAAQTFLDAAPAVAAALAPAHYAPWAELGLALAPTVGERDFFAALPRGLDALAEAECGAVLGLIRRLAASPTSAHAAWRALPATLAGLGGAERAALLGVLAGFGPGAAGGIAEIAPVLGAMVRAVPAGERLAALARVAALAPGTPAAALAALRVLPRLHEEAAPAEVARWFVAGASIAAENPEAGKAYFALESRTSWSVLRAGSAAARLEDTQGVWRKLVQMVTGEAVSVHGIDPVTLRPPLATEGDAAEVALPFEIDWLGTHEENWRVYRFLALQLAGRRAFGTHAVAREAAAAPLLEDLFLLAEGVRVQQRLAAAYRGAAAEGRALCARLLARWAATATPSRTLVLDALLALAVAEGPRPPWLAAEVAEPVLRLLRPLAARGATAADSLRTAAALAALLGVEARLGESEIEAFLALDDYGSGGDDLPLGGEEAARGTPALAPAAPPAEDGLRLELGPEAEAAGEGGRALSLEELRRLLEAGARITQAAGEAHGPGLPVTDLAGKLPPGTLDALRRLLGTDEEAAAPLRARQARAAGAAFQYDEWDHRIGDYRRRWCRLVEVHLPGDSGEFFGRALLDYATLVPEVRRQFQHLRPEQYRVVRGLEDGEDFDLNAVVDARIELRARRSPSQRLYRARVREARDVATLFLLDMSASTDEPMGPGEGGRPGRRIIDAIKAALVVMTEALDELGDAYAIYGFSGQGRDGVEFYPVKGFSERLGPSVKARIGGIEPRRSTRMGTALRHATQKMAQVGARSKHLILLSDGFPQDHDYGEDRRSHVYGIRDTAVALREVDAAGITPFCITVDRAGHDYLREMCDAQRYLVIDDVAALPRELPKIYGQVVRA